MSVWLVSLAVAQDVIDETSYPEAEATSEAVLSEEAEALLQEERDRLSADDEIPDEVIAWVEEWAPGNDSVFIAPPSVFRYESIGSWVTDPWSVRLFAVFGDGTRFEMARRDTDGDGLPNLAYDDNGRSWILWYLPEMEAYGTCLKTQTLVPDWTPFAPAGSDVPLPLSMDDFTEGTDPGEARDDFGQLDPAFAGLGGAVESASEADDTNAEIDKLALGYMDAGYVVLYNGGGYDVWAISCGMQPLCEVCENNSEAWTPTASAIQVCPCPKTGGGTASVTFTATNENGGEASAEVEPEAGVTNKLGKVAFGVDGSLTWSLTGTYTTPGVTPDHCNILKEQLTQLIYVTDPPEVAGGADDVDEEDDEEDQDRIGVDEKNETGVQGASGESNNPEEEDEGEEGDGSDGSGGDGGDDNR